MTSILNIESDDSEKDVDRTTPTPTSSVKEAADRFSGGSKSSGTGAAAATARTIYDQAKETAGQAYDAVSEKAVTKIDEQKSTLSGGLSIVADGIRQVSDNLGSATTDSSLAESAAKYTKTAARKIEDVAGYFENKTVRDMARDLEGFARRNPVVFLGAAFGLGFLAARFLKSGSPLHYEKGAGARFSAKSVGRASASKGGEKTYEPTTADTF